MNLAKPVIVLLTGMDLTDQNWERTGYAFLVQEFEIVVFDCREFLKRYVSERTLDDYRFRNIVRIGSVAHLDEALRTYRPMFAIDFIGPCREMKYIQPLLKMIECKFVVQKFGSLPRLSITRRLLFRAYNNFSNKNESHVGPQDTSAPCPRRFNAFQRHFSQLAKPFKLWVAHRNSKYYGRVDISVAAGQIAVNECLKLSRKTISVLSADAHRFQTIDNRRTLVFLVDLPAHFAVFIDDAIIHASDWKSLGISPPVQAQNYFEDLNKYFADFENAYALPIVIAGHPQGQHNDSYTSSFGDRRVIFGNTPELVCGSRLAIVHASTATSFAVLTQKPIMVLSSQALKKSPYGLQIKALAKELGSGIHYIDRSFKKTDWNLLSQLSYNNYAEKFIAEEGCSEEFPWTKFIEHYKSRI